MNHASILAANKDIVRRLLTDGINQRQPDALEQLVAADFVNHFTAQRGRDALARAVDVMHAAFAGLHIEVKDMVAEADRVAVRWTMHARHVGVFAGEPPSGEQVERDAMVIYRVENGQVTESWLQPGSLRAVSAQAASIGAGAAVRLT